MNPKGGTEILKESLQLRLSETQLEGINLISSICHPSLIQEGPKNVIWQHLSYDQPNVQYMTDRRFVDSVDYFVYVSHWQFQRFRERFQIPEYKSIVIRNAIEDGPFDVLRWQDIKKIKLIYTSTPWRGLSVLVRAIQILNDLRDDFECDIYSSTKIYGTQFQQSEGDKFEPLFELCRQTPNINYLGYAPNEEVRAAVSKSHLFAYPSIFEETSCLSALEALYAGCKVVTTNHGALPETCGDFADYVEYEPNQEELAQKYAKALNSVMDSVLFEDHDYLKQHQHFKKYWTWDMRKYDWFDFLDEIKEK